MARLVGQWAPGTHLSVSDAGWQACVTMSHFYVDAQDLSSYPLDLTAYALSFPTEMFPQPQEIFLVSDIFNIVDLQMFI